MKRGRCERSDGAVVDEQGGPRAGCGYGPLPWSRASGEESASLPSIASRRSRRRAGERDQRFASVPADQTFDPWAVLPTRCVYAKGREWCSVYVDHYRVRKTGPRHGVAVVGCAVHRRGRYRGAIRSPGRSFWLMVVRTKVARASRSVPRGIRPCACCRHPRTAAVQPSKLAARRSRTPGGGCRRSSEMLPMGQP